MKALILLVPFIVLAAVWFAVVRYRGRIPKSTAHGIGVVAGLILGVLVLSAVLPEPSDAEKAKIASDRAAQQAVDFAKEVEQKRLDSIAAGAAERRVPQAALDEIELLYISHKIYPRGGVACDPKYFELRSVVGCWNVTLDGKSAPHLWLYQGGKFKSLNGPARGLAETKFSNERNIEVSKLPLPSDIDVGAIFEAFEKG